MAFKGAAPEITNGRYASLHAYSCYRAGHTRHCHVFTSSPSRLLHLTLALTSLRFTLCPAIHTLDKLYSMAWTKPSLSVAHRLAMVGFVAALFAEISTGLPVTGQLEMAPAAIGFTFVLFAFASLVPILKARVPFVVCQFNCILLRYRIRILEILLVLPSAPYLHWMLHRVVTGTSEQSSSSL